MDAIDKSTWDFVKQVLASQEQQKVVVARISELLCALDAEYRAERLLGTKTSTALDELYELLQDLSAFAQMQVADNFVKVIHKKDERISRIESYHQHILAVANSFQVSELVNTQAWEWDLRNNSARLEDQRLLHEQLDDFHRNKSKLAEALNVQQTNVSAMMISLQRHLGGQVQGDRERRFLSDSLQYLSTVGGHSIRLEDWMVTSFDVDIGQKIGEGEFGQVFKATWNRTQVALKVINTEGNFIPSSRNLRREIKTWSGLRHPHIIRFLSANVFDDRPFLVMPYFNNGNARDYLINNPDCNRQKILGHISLGLAYLHSRNIIHGNLKPLNVLIDDSDDDERAVLCDFGLSSIKVDVIGHTVTTGETRNFVTDSYNWMAPERLAGGLPRKPCDIYAFGMIIYWINTAKIPLGHVSHSDLVDIVVNQRARPEWPGNDEAPQLTNEIWNLAKHCWAHEPSTRPNITAVCDALNNTGAVISKYETPEGPLFLPIRRDTATAVSLPSLLNSRASIRNSKARPAPPTNKLLYENPQPSPPAGGVFHQTSILKAHTDHVSSIAFSPNGERLVSGSWDKTIKVWDLKSKKVVLWFLRGHTDWVRSVAFSPDGTTIVSGSRDCTLRVWDANTQKPVLKIFEGHKGHVWSVAVSPEGRMIASCSSNEPIGIWDLETGKLIRTLTDSSLGGAKAVAFSSDGKYFVSGSDNSIIRVWDAKTWQPACMVTSCKGGVSSVTFSPDGKWIASGGDQREVCVWDTATGKLVTGPMKGHTDTVSSVAFSPNGKWIASGSYDRTIRIWDATTGSQISKPLREHTDAVTSVAFSPNGMRIASGSRDNTVRIFEDEQAEAVNQCAAPLNQSSSSSGSKWQPTTATRVLDTPIPTPLPSPAVVATLPSTIPAIAPPTQLLPSTGAKSQSTSATPVAAQSNISTPLAVENAAPQPPKNSQITTKKSRFAGRLSIILKKKLLRWKNRKSASKNDVHTK